MTTTTTTSPFFPDLAMYIWGEPGRAQYTQRPRVWEDIYGENQFTPESYFQASDRNTGDFPVIIAIRGTFVGTVTLQRSFDDGTTWHNVATWAAPAETLYANPNGSIKYRLGVKTGEFTSGSIHCNLSQ